MTDDEELQARLRRLAVKPDKDERFWTEMAAHVRADYEASRLVPMRRRRRWAAPLVAGLAMAATFALWMRSQRPVVPLNDPVSDDVTVFDEEDSGEWIEELSPAQLDRVERAFKKEGV
ncbi:MAG: hypothetical protein JWN44_3050 [Myxococcales bacterium]|nr:hypothetical protein [Myxococcales bacterium]